MQHAAESSISLYYLDFWFCVSIKFMEIDFYMYLYSKRVLGCLASVFQPLLPFTGATQLQTFFFVAEGVEQGQGNIPPVWGLLCLESLTFISRNSSMGSWDMTCSMHLLQWLWFFLWVTPAQSLLVFSWGEAQQWDWDVSSRQRIIFCKIPKGSEDRGRLLVLPCTE